MSESLIAENVTIKLVVEDVPRRVVLVLDRACDSIVVPWHDAFVLAETMERVYKDVGELFPLVLRSIILEEQAQIGLSQKDGLVTIMFQWTDRVYFTALEALFLVSRAIRKAAQDSNLECRGVYFTYGKDGMLTKLYNRNTNTTQLIR